MKQAIVIAAALLLIGCGQPRTASAELRHRVWWFPLVFNEGQHPPVVIDCYGYSQVPGYDGPPEYPLEVQPEQTYVTCYANPGCRLGHAGQYGPLVYKCGAGTCESSGVLAGDITILMTNARIDNRHQDYWLVATKETGGVVTAARKLYPFEQKLYTGGTHIAALPPDLAIGEANGFGLWRPAEGVVAWLTFSPCAQYESQGVGKPERWSGQELLEWR